jgi:hypothetical protein
MPILKPIYHYDLIFTIIYFLLHDKSSRAPHCDGAFNQILLILDSEV